MQAIPTDYRGHVFRSRLEAKWACFFDNVGWPWEYEPLDLDGYIPDFVLTFPYRPMLVEVKPVLEQREFAAHWPRIQQSGWKHEALIVGAKIFDDGNGWAALGSHCEREENGEDGKLIAEDWREGWGILHTCQNCGRISFHNSTYIFTCRVNGCYDGDHYLDIWDYQEGRELFADCSAVVQYNA